MPQSNKQGLKMGICWAAYVAMWVVVGWVLVESLTTSGIMQRLGSSLICVGVSTLVVRFRKKFIWSRKDYEPQRFKGDPVFKSWKDGKWYFWDECWSDAVGPGYSSEDICREALSRYCLWLEFGKPDADVPDLGEETIIKTQREDDETDVLNQEGFKRHD